MQSSCLSRLVQIGKRYARDLSPSHCSVFLEPQIDTAPPRPATVTTRSAPPYTTTRRRPPRTMHHHTHQHFIQVNDHGSSVFRLAFANPGVTVHTLEILMGTGADIDVNAVSRPQNRKWHLIDVVFETMHRLGIRNDHFTLDMGRSRRCRVRSTMPSIAP